MSARGKWGSGERRKGRVLLSHAFRSLSLYESPSCSQIPASPTEGEGEPAELSCPQPLPLPSWPAVFQPANECHEVGGKQKAKGKAKGVKQMSVSVSVCLYNPNGIQMVIFVLFKFYELSRLLFDSSLPCLPALPSACLGGPTAPCLPGTVALSPVTIPKRCLFQRGYRWWGGQSAEAGGEVGRVGWGG